MAGKLWLAIFFVFISLTACSRMPWRDQSSAPSPTPANQPAGPPTTTLSSQNSFADVVERVAPAVVSVHSARRARPPRLHPFFNDPRFRDFFGNRAPATPESQLPRIEGLGSGVIVSPEGFILTNHHVIDGAEEIRVELNDHRTFPAEVVGSDAPSDLAVLKISENNLPVLTMGDSDRALVGDVVLAIGNPLGLEQTVTAGIISAKGRATGLSDGSFEDFLQTDAPINRGNSGGALVSANGELVGINSQILSPTGGNIGIGFAIPVNMAKNVMDQLVRTGRVRRGSLGVTVQTLTSARSSELGLQNVRGALIAAVVRGSAAARAGLQPGDVITAFNGNPVADPNSLRNFVAATQPGTEVTLTVWRDRAEQQVRATLGELNTQTS